MLPLLPPLPHPGLLVVCCLVVRRPILSSHAIMQPLTLLLPAAFANICLSLPLPPHPPTHHHNHRAATTATSLPLWSNSPSYIDEERGSGSTTTSIPAAAPS
jgi:hypothetical protein